MGSDNVGRRRARIRYVAGPESRWAARGSVVAVGDRIVSPPIVRSSSVRRRLGVVIFVTFGIRVGTREAVPEGRAWSGSMDDRRSVSSEPIRKAFDLGSRSPVGSRPPDGVPGSPRRPGTHQAHLSAQILMLTLSA
jgi:hypothetical protein